MGSFPSVCLRRTVVLTSPFFFFSILLCGHSPYSRTFRYLSVLFFSFSPPVPQDNSNKLDLPFCSHSLSPCQHRTCSTPSSPRSPFESESFFYFLLYSVLTRGGAADYPPLAERDRRFSLFSFCPLIVRAPSLSDLSIMSPSGSLLRTFVR